MEGAYIEVRSLADLHFAPDRGSDLSVFPVCSQERWFDTVNIVLVGKYTSLQDSYMSVIKSLEHAAMRCQRKLVLEVRCSPRHQLALYIF